jgi:hypothetical protein
MENHMKSVNTYNLKEAIEKANDGKRTCRDNEIAIIEGSGGVVVVNSDGVHWNFKSMKDDITIELFDKKPGTIAMFPSAEAKCPLDALVERCEPTVQPLHEFVRRFGSRIETNYNILLKSLKGIGLIPDDYPRNPEEAEVNKYYAEV